VSWYRWQGDTLRLALRVQPRARENAFGEPLGDELRVRLKAPPVDGKANAGLVDFLARACSHQKKVLRLGVPDPTPSTSRGRGGSDAGNIAGRSCSKSAAGASLPRMAL
jgi:hypothetical protein